MHLHRNPNPNSNISTVNNLLYYHQIRFVFERIIIIEMLQFLFVNVIYFYFYLSII
jgi:hypothetical protein